MNGARDRRYLRSRYRILLGYFGTLLNLLGLLLLTPVLLIPCYHSELHLLPGFLIPGFVLAGGGYLLRSCCRPPPHAVVSSAEAAALVLATWLTAIVGGAVPFVWAGLDPTRAIFEATSGWTTTGLSVLDVDRTSPLLLFLRSLMQLVGGAGLAILMLSAITGPAGVGLSAAEGRPEQLVPHVRQSAQLVIKLYAVYLVVGLLALRLAGMDWFDALNHACSAVSTGGFSTRSASVGYWNSLAIEAVLMVLMLLGALNFLTAYALWRRRWQAVFGNGEIRLSAGLLLMAGIVLLFGTTLGLQSETGRALRVTLFQTVSALTTTGYSTTDISAWNSLGWLVLMAAMLVGGHTGSTAGGCKQHRLYLLGRSVWQEVREVFRPRGETTAETFWLGEQRRSLAVPALQKAGAYVSLYLLSWLVGGSVLSAFGYPLADSLFEFASALGTVGLSVGLTGADAPDGLLWTQSVGMLLGRLEFFVVFRGILKLCRDLPHVMTPLQGD